jgi:glycosyltransferase involved in cell wall biosynthesis
MHVAFTMYGWADEGGGTMLPRQLAKALVRRGHRVSVIYAATEPRPGLPPYHVEARVEDGVELFGIHNRPAVFNEPQNPAREIDDPQARRALRAILEHLRPDVVHYHSLLGFSMGITADVDAMGIASVFTSHNYWPICPRMYLLDGAFGVCDGPSEDGRKCAACVGAPHLAPLFAERLAEGRRMLGQRVDRHLAVSSRVRDLYVRAGHDASRIRVLHQQPESVERIWAEQGSRREPLARLERPLRVGFIGNLYPHKGVHVLVQALQELGPREVEGHLYGSGSAQYAEALRGLDAKGLVTFHGGYEPHQLAELLADVDVVCMSSICEECAPLVLAEAHAARTPVVASRIGGIPDFVRDGVDGFLATAGSAASFAGALRRFVDDPELVGRMQAAIRPPRGFDAFVDDVVEQYDEVRAERAARPRQAALGGARRFAALAFAEELAAEPELLRGYGERFGAADDATLVIYAPGWSEEELGARLAPALELAGLDGEDGADLLAVAVDDPVAAEPALASGVSALFSRRQAAAFAGLPRVEEPAELRVLAERLWAA